MAEDAMSLEERRLQEAAQEYVRKGYRVVIRPGDAQVPAFLSGLRPDLVAYGESENVVVESRSRFTLNDPDDSLLALSTAVDGQQGWSLDLFVTNPEDPPLAPEEAEWGPEAVRARIDAIRHLLLTEQEEAALLVAWSAAEATLRIVARREGIELESTAPGFVLKTLYSQGVLDRAEYELLDYIRRSGDLLAHGFRGPEPDRVLVGKVLHKIEELLELQAA